MCAILAMLLVGGCALAFVLGRRTGWKHGFSEGLVYQAEEINSRKANLPKAHRTSS